jgi:hypothetical protein
MPYIKPEVVAKAKQMDFLTYLQNYEPDELVRLSAGIYSTRTHDSLKISNGKWAWHSTGIGGRSALDWLIKVRNMSFTGAVEQIVGWAAVKPPVFIPAEKEKPKPSFVLPKPDKDTREVSRWEAEARGCTCSSLRLMRSHLRRLKEYGHRTHLTAICSPYPVFTNRERTLQKAHCPLPLRNTLKTTPKSGAFICTSTMTLRGGLPPKRLRWFCQDGTT